MEAGFTAVKMNATEELQFIDSYDKIDAVLERVDAISSGCGKDFGIAIDFHGRVHRPMAKILAKKLIPIALSSCLQVDATCYNAVIQEQSMGIHYNVGKSVMDYVDNPEDFRFVDGYVKLPTKPGLGVEVNKELVLEENRTPHNWKNPVWRHGDGSVAEW